LSANTLADLCRRRSTLWEELDIVKNEVLARGIGRAENDNGFGVIEIVWEANIVPTGITNTASIAGLVAIYCPCKVGPGEFAHIDGLRNVALSGACPTVGLVIVHLCDEDRVRHVERADIAPSDILRYTVPARPAFKARSI
jgi:hypothetical protein